MILIPATTLGIFAVAKMYVGRLAKTRDIRKKSKNNVKRSANIDLDADVPLGSTARVVGDDDIHPLTKRSVTMRSFIHKGRIKFGIRPRTRANEIVIDNWVRKTMLEHGVRESHIARFHKTVTNGILAITDLDKANDEVWRDEKVMFNYNDYHNESQTFMDWCLLPIEEKIFGRTQKLGYSRA
jgi:hypothetical protein